MAEPAEKKKGKPGTKPHEPTDERQKFVTEMSRAGVAQERIAKALGMSVDSLARHYGEQIAAGLDDFYCKLEKVGMQVALDPDPRNNVWRIFLFKARLGYRELTAKDPDAVPPEQLTNDQVRERVAAIARSRAGGDEARPHLAASGDAVRPRTARRRAG